HFLDHLSRRSFKPMTLAELKPGQKATVVGFEQSDGPSMHRIMQLGLLENTEVELIRKAPTGDPVEIRLLGYSLSLRKSEAQMVLIEGVK
ncbi:MAG: FeoA family protein, partial [Pseudomonadota bacterium]